MRLLCLSLHQSTFLYMGQHVNSLIRESVAFLGKPVSNHSSIHPIRFSGIAHSISGVTLIRNVFVMSVRTSEGCLMLHS